MHIRTGNLWEHLTDDAIVCITTNGVIKKDGTLVMGKGIAKTAAERYPHLPHEWAQRIALAGKKIRVNNNYVWEYGILWPKAEFPYSKNVAAFQTKLHWVDNSTPQLIALSTSRLQKIALAIPNIPIYLPMPGCGNGGLTKAIVMPIITTLPDNVYVWEYK